MNETAARDSTKRDDPQMIVCVRYDVLQALADVSGWHAYRRITDRTVGQGLAAGTVQRRGKPAKRMLHERFRIFLDADAMREDQLVEISILAMARAYVETLPPKPSRVPEYKSVSQGAKKERDAATY